MRSCVPPSPTHCAAKTASVDADGLLGFTASRLISSPHTPIGLYVVCLRVPRGDFRESWAKKKKSGTKQDFDSCL